MQTIVIPVLGSGFSKVEVPREIIKEIIKSFTAASLSKKFTEKLTIVIHPEDYINFDMNISEIHEFLKYQCKYIGSLLWLNGQSHQLTR